MKKFQASADIIASHETIWKILADAEGYPDWDPGMVRVEGRIALGEQVKFFTTFNPERAFAVKVTTFDHGRKMVFTGGMPLGLFRSERTHTLVQDPGGHTRFETQEVFSGLLEPLFGKKIPDLTENFIGFIAALKDRAEHIGGQPTA